MQPYNVTLYEPKHCGPYRVFDNYSEMYGEVLFFAYWHPYWKCTNMLLQEELDFVLEKPDNSLQVTFVCNAVQDDFGNLVKIKGNPTVERSQDATY